MADPATTYYIVFSGLCSLVINPTPDAQTGDKGAFVACAQTHGHRTMLTYPLPIYQGEVRSQPQITYRTDSVDVSGLTLLLKSANGAASQTYLSDKEACDFLSVLNLYSNCKVDQPIDLDYFKKYPAQSRAYFAKRGDTIIELGSHSNVSDIRYYQLPSPIDIKDTEPASKLSFSVHTYTRFRFSIEGSLQVEDGRSGTLVAEVEAAKNTKDPNRRTADCSSDGSPNKDCQLRELHIANGPHFYDMVPLHKPDVHFRSLFSSFAVPPTTYEEHFRVPIAGQPRAGGAPRCFGKLMAHE